MPLPLGLRQSTLHLPKKKKEQSEKKTTPPHQAETQIAREEVWLGPSDGRETHLNTVSLCCQFGNCWLDCDGTHQEAPIRGPRNSLGIHRWVAVKLTEVFVPLASPHAFGSLIPWEPEKKVQENQEEESLPPKVPYWWSWLSSHLVNQNYLQDTAPISETEQKHEFGAENQHIGFQYICNMSKEQFHNFCWLSLFIY